MLSASINSRVDLAFEKIFGTGESKDLLISLINSIVGEENQVVDAALLNPYIQKNFKGDKPSILEIKAKGSAGETFNIKIQITDAADCDKRALYYLGKTLDRAIKIVGEPLHKLEKAMGIHILNFSLDPRVAKVPHH